MQNILYGSHKKAVAERTNLEPKLKLSYIMYNMTSKQKKNKFMKKYTYVTLIEQKTKIYFRLLTLHTVILS